MKTVLGIVLAIALIGGGIWFLANTANEYEIVVGDEISELEAELAAIDARVEAGDLSPEAALVARTNIISRLDTINAQMQAAGRASLTSAQKQQLNDALSRLKRVLVTYSDTLNVVDTVAAADSRTSRSGGSLVRRFAGAVAVSQTAVANADIEVENDATVEAALEDIIEDAPETVGEAVEETDLPDSFETETEEDVATTTDETTDSEDETTDTSETTETDSTDVEVEAEADIEVQ